MKKVVVYILAAVMTLTSVFVMTACGNEKKSELELKTNEGVIYGNEKTGGKQGEKQNETLLLDEDERLGTFYTVKAAYEAGYINKNELNAMAYFHNHGIRQTIPDATEFRLKSAFAKYQVMDRINGVDVYGTYEDVSIREYLGRFNDCIAAMIDYKSAAYIEPLWSDIIDGVTIDYNNGQALTIYVLPENEYRHYDYVDYGEETVYTVVNTDHDFTDDCILVVMKKAAGGINKTYSVEYFEYENIESIKDLTYFTNPDSEFINKEKFHQILQLNLKEKSKQKVVEAVYAIQQLSFVRSAEPNEIVEGG